MIALPPSVKPVNSVENIGGVGGEGGIPVTGPPQARDETTDQGGSSKNGAGLTPDRRRAGSTGVGSAQERGFCCWCGPGKKGRRASKRRERHACLYGGVCWGGRRQGAGGSNYACETLGSCTSHAVTSSTVIGVLWRKNNDLHPDSSYHHLAYSLSCKGVAGGGVIPWLPENGGVVPCLRC